jgi:signal transduction histidine kinase
MSRKNRFIDVALVVGCLVLTALAVKGRWSSLPWPAIVAAGVVGSVAQGVRRRWPLVAAIAGTASYPISGNPGPWLVGLYSGAAYTRRLFIPVAAVAGWAGFAAWSWLDEGRLQTSDAEYSVIAAGVVVVAGVWVSARRANRHERARQAEKDRLVLEERARTEERTRIAREMHDVLAHKVSLIALHAGALEVNADGEPDRIRQGAELIRTTAREALQELRGVLGVLQAGATADRGAEPDDPFADLDALVKAATTAGQPVELHDRAGTLSPATARVVYRVVQEGLTNARKHAPGAPVTVDVDRNENGAVTVTLENPLSETSPLDLPGAGAGLVGLAERVRLADGSLHSGPTADRRWRLRATL